MSLNVRIYRGLTRRERAGWILGLTPLQAGCCVALALPVLLALSSGAVTTALTLAGAHSVIAALIVLPVRGRPGILWLWHLALFQVGATFGWSRWQAQATSDASADPGKPDLPGVLQRLHLPDGPPLRDQGRVCLIHDTAEGRWGATARLAHTGVGMLSDTQCEALATRLGNLLLSLGHRGVVDRLSLLVRTVPDDGQEYAAWRQRHRSGDAPDLAQRVAAELDRTIGAASVRHETYVTVSGTEDALRKPAAAAGGGVDGRAAVLYRVLDGLDDGLRSLGAHRVTWLSGSELAVAVRTGFNPAAASTLEAQRHRRGAAALPWAAAGPVHAPAPQRRFYLHDGFASVAYSVLMPEIGTTFGSLAGLLAVREPGERRSLAIHYEIMSHRKARTAVRGNRFRTGVVRDWKASRGFNRNAMEARESSGARAQERAVAAGHSLVRVAVVSAVTVPAEWNIEDVAARVETDVADRFRLLRLELAQDTAFVAATLPLGIALPRLRGGRA
ncbi:hypothetical protein L3Q67_01795 [Saccharothrix sp. AJ9571]|nr:hypothetical protein L3Q67_01795 [Saccharothrix sp. AJ9571]